MPSAAKVVIHPSQFPGAVRRDLLESLRARRVNHKFHYDSVRQSQKWLAVHRALSPFATDPSCVEVYAAGLRNIDKILELDHQLETIPGLRYKVDRNHDLVYLEMDETGITLRDLRAMFRKIGLEPRFIGAVPDEMRSKSRTQPLAS
jgi:hypothetical protein